MIDHHLPEISDEHLDLLAEQIDLGKCVLVLGPWASCDAATGMPVNQLLAKSLADKIGFSINENTTLGMVATEFLKINESNLVLDSTASKFLREQQKPAALLKAIAEIPWRVIVTTAQDNLLQKAFSEVGKTYKEGFYRMDKTQPDEFDEKSQVPFIYQLFGKVYPDKGYEDLVLTQQDQMKYLNSVQGVGKETRLPTALRLALKDAQCFLFLGFDYDNWYLRVLLHVLEFSNRATMVFGLPENIAEGKMKFETHAFFKSLYKFSFFQENAITLVQDIRGKLQNAATDTPAETGRKLKLLYIHAAADEEQMKELDKSMTLLKEKYGIEARSIQNITAGSVEGEEEKAMLAEANLILPFISADLIADDALYTLTKQALTRHGLSKVRVVAVNARPVHGGTDLFRGKTTILPAESISLSMMDKNIVYSLISQELEKFVAAL